MTIWKYLLESSGSHKLKIPKGSRPLSVHLQKQDAPVYGGTIDRVCVWFEVDPEEAVTEVTVYDVNTGGEVPENAHFIGTVSSRNETLVSHIYWKPICSTGLMST